MTENKTEAPSLGDVDVTRVVAFLNVMLVVVVLYFALRWGYTEYWISQHCTTVLGTRVCQ